MLPNLQGAVPAYWGTTHSCLPANAIFTETDTGTARAPVKAMTFGTAAPTGYVAAGAFSKIRKAIGDLVAALVLWMATCVGLATQLASR